MKPVKYKSNADLAEEWDSIAEERYIQISENKDMTYLNTLCPIFIERIAKGNFNNLLDFGCGVGYLTRILSQYVVNCEAIDLSAKSIDYCRKYHGGMNINYAVGDIVDFKYKSKIDVCISNMSLMDCLDIDKVTNRIYDLLSKRGLFLVCIPNPLIMPRYWGYEKYRWFKYNDEIIIEANFRTSSTGESLIKTTHIHRPISQYFGIFRKAGFKVIKYQEISGHATKNIIIDKYQRYIYFELTK